MSRDYELAFILNPEVNEEQTRGILDRVEQIVANYGGQTVKVSQWGRRRLAYPIERHRDGFYVFIDMILTPETVVELERTLKVSEIVLRHMVRKRDPKAVQKEREEREARAAAAAAPPVPEATTPEVAAPDTATSEVTAPDTATPDAPEQEPAVAEETDENIPALVDEEDVPPAIEESEASEAVEA